MSRVYKPISADTYMKLLHCEAFTEYLKFGYITGWINSCGLDIIFNHNKTIILIADTEEQITAFLLRHT